MGASDAVAGRLAGRRALITGAAGGMGRAVARRFAAEGAQLALTDLAQQPLEALAAELRASGAEVTAHVADARSEREVAAAVGSAANAHGGLEVLYNNAGVLLAGRDRRVGELDVEVWDDVLAINARGQFLFCKHSLPSLLVAEHPAIVNVASVAGYAGNPIYHAYAASKATVIGLTLSIAQGYGADGLRAIALCPGFVDTPMVETFTSDADATAEVVARTALGRFGTPDEIAAAGAYLVSQDASFVTSTVFGVHGGLVQ